MRLGSRCRSLARSAPVSWDASVIAKDPDPLHAALHRVAPGKCMSCGANDWLDTTNTPVMIPTVTTAGTFVPGHGMEAIVCVCARCGYMRFHAAQILRRVQAISEEHASE